MRISLYQSLHLIFSHSIDQSSRQDFPGAAFRVCRAFLLLASEVSLDHMSVLSVKRNSQPVHFHNDIRSILCKIPDHVRICQITAAFHGVPEMILRAVIFTHHI